MISCIIPCFNEASRIGYLLDIIAKEKLFEIIIVDDGSQDQTSEVIKKYLEYSHIHLIQHKKNLGKYNAMKSGYHVAKGDSIAFLDGDYTRFDYSELIAGIRIFESKSLDMLIYKRKNTLPRVSVMGFDIILSGARIVKKDLFNEILQYNINPYEIELLMGKVCLESKRHVGWIECNRENEYKFKKKGYIEGFIDDLKMYKEIGLFRNERYKQYFAYKDLEYQVHE